MNFGGVEVMSKDKGQGELGVIKGGEMEIPDVYTDSVGIAFGVYGFSFRFGVIEDDPTDPKPVAKVRMSPQHTLVLCQLLKKNMRLYEEKIGKINLPKELYEEMGIEEL